MKPPSPKAERNAEVTSARPTSLVDENISRSSFFPSDTAALFERVDSLADADSLDKTFQQTTRLLAEINVAIYCIKFDCCGYKGEWQQPSPTSVEMHSIPSLHIQAGAVALDVRSDAQVPSHAERAVGAILKACALQVERIMRRIYVTPASAVVEANDARSLSAPSSGASANTSECARRFQADIERGARLPYSLLITGETGTGKTLAAREIHRRSQRAPHPFLELNCASLPEQLVEAELFGYRKGAFTGADRDHKGLFEEADGGTLFLDEIGDLPPAIQNKLLKAIEEKQIKRLGTNRVVTCDVRIIAATSRNLQEMIRRGAFREDLFCRLAMLKIETPALSERRADIPSFVTHFLCEAAGEVSRLSNRTITYMIETGAVEMLAAHVWTGNIRALRNAVFELTSYVAEGEPVTMERVGDTLIKLAREQSERGSSPAPADEDLETPQRATGFEAQLAARALQTLAEEGDIILPLEVCLLRRGETLRDWTARVKRCGIEAARKSSGGTFRQAAERLGVSQSGIKCQLNRIRPASNTRLSANDA